MSNMRTVVVAFSKPKKNLIGAQAISWWTGRPYSHVLLVTYSNAFQSSLVYHAAHGMVHFMSEENFLKTNTIPKAYELQVTEEQYTRIMKHCINIAGSSYGYIELLKIFIGDVAHKFNIDFKFANSRGYICSELLGSVLSELQIAFNKPQHLLSPGDIDLALEAYGATKV